MKIIHIFWVAIVGYSCILCQGWEYEFSEYAEEDKAMDEMIVNAALSSKEFEFFYDTDEKLLKLEYDIVYSMDEWDHISQGMDEMEDDDDDFDDFDDIDFDDDDFDDFDDLFEYMRRRRRRRKRTAAVIIGTRGAMRWTDGRIPYEFNEGEFSDAEKDTMRSGMAEWANHTCLTFHERQDENRLLFKNAGGCFSRVGMVGGAQIVGMAKDCRYKGVTLHEVGHAIGLHHEQTRPDRDKHVKILSKNIPKPQRFNFQRYTWEIIKNLDIPYDYSSIMHYGKNAFSMNGKPTIETLDPKMQDTIGQKRGLSFRDIKTVNIMYKCGKATTACTKSDSDCPGEGFVDKNCECVCPGSPTQLCSQGGGNESGGGTAIVKKKTVVKEEKECEDQHLNCPYWSKTGECPKNPSYMLVYCKMSCKECGGQKHKEEEEKKKTKKKTKAPCEDLHTSCSYWSGQGFCRQGFVPYMKANCKKSCKLCNSGKKAPSDTAAKLSAPVVTSCTDSNDLCRSWSQTGECHKNPDYMEINCRFSCGLCASSQNGKGTGNGVHQMMPSNDCTDHNTNCAYWAGIGECMKNQAFMFPSCKKSCRQC